MSFYDIVILVVLFGRYVLWLHKGTGLANRIRRCSRRQLHCRGPGFAVKSAQYVQANPPFNNIAAMLIIFVASSLFIWLAYAYINKSIEKAELDGFNRQIGALVGAVLGVLLIGVITMFSVSLLGPSAHDSIHRSRLGPYVIPRNFRWPKHSCQGSYRRLWIRTSISSISRSATIPNQSLDLYPNFQGLNPVAVTGGSQYPTGQTLILPTKRATRETGVR